KDILYIETKDNHSRRSIQTVYYETLVSLTKLLTPIIPHTTEEVWEHINGVVEEFVQLTDLPEAREIEGFTEADQSKWDLFMKVRDDVLKSLEEARTEKIIGNSLEAKVTIEANDEDVKEVLSNIKDIHQLLIVSEAVINETHPDAKEY